MLTKEENQHLRNELQYVVRQLRAVSIMDENFHNLYLGFKDTNAFRDMLEKAEKKAKARLAALAKLHTVGDSDPIDRSHFEDV